MHSLMERNVFSFQGLQGNLCLKIWYPIQWVSSKSRNIPIPWLHTHRILVILLFPKSFKICIHIAIQLHINIRVESQVLTLRYNQVVAGPLDCLIMTPPWIMDETDTLVHFKMYVRHKVSVEIHQSHSTVTDSLDLSMKLSVNILGIVYTIICGVAVHWHSYTHGIPIKLDILQDGLPRC